MSKVIKQLAGDVEKEKQDPSDSIKQKENASIASTIIKAEEGSIQSK